MNTPPAQGNLRDIASGPGAMLPRLAGTPGAVQLSLRVEDGDGNFREEVFFVVDGMLVGCGTAIRSGDALMARLLEFAFQPYGLYSCAPATVPAEALADTPVPVRELLLAYARGVSEPGEVLSTSCSPGTVLRLSENIDQLRSQVKFSQQEWKLIFRVNNKRTVEEVASALGAGVPDFPRLLLACLSTGAVYPDRGPAQSGSGLFKGGSVAESGSNASAPGPGTGTEEATKQPPISPSTRPLILAVDDSRTVQRVVQMALAELDVEVELADSGEQALELAAKRAPDLVILDIIMPGMDGFRTSEALRKLLAPRKVPIVMLTSRDGTLDSLRGRLAGATAYLTKPFQDEELRRTVKTHLKRSRDS